MSQHPNVRSVYLPIDIVEELEAEAKRLQRPVTRLIRRAWKLAHAEIRKMPATEAGFS